MKNKITPNISGEGIFLVCNAKKCNEVVGQVLNYWFKGYSKNHFITFGEIYCEKHKKLSTGR